jgi:predicted nucleic acid-binding protein
LTRLRALLKKHRRIALDTSIFIYYLEENPTYVEMADEVFEWLERSHNTAVTSTLTLTESLVRPYREENDSLVEQYFGLLSTFPNLEWVAPEIAIADTAARIRARHRLRTPDALQAATAVHCGATAFITNDPAFKRVTELSVGVLDELLVV